MSIFSADYSLAPKATFPQQQSESVAAYRYLLDTEGIPADRIIMAGESAGGHLVLSCLMSPSEKDLARPKGAMLLYPWVDLTNHSSTFESNRNNDVISKRLLDRCAEAVMGQKGRTDAMNLENLLKQWQPASEQNWEDILPQITWVTVGSHDILLHDVQTFVKNAQDAGARVTLDVFPEKPHSFNFAMDRESVDRYCELNPEDEVLPGMMAGSQAISEGLFAVFLRWERSRWEMSV